MKNTGKLAIVAGIVSTVGAGVVNVSCTREVPFSGYLMTSVPFNIEGNRGASHTFSELIVDGKSKEIQTFEGKQKRPEGSLSTGWGL